DERQEVGIGRVHAGGDGVAQKQAAAGRIEDLAALVLRPTVVPEVGRPGLQARQPEQVSLVEFGVGGGNAVEGGGNRRTGRFHQPKGRRQVDGKRLGVVRGRGVSELTKQGE